MKKHNFSAGPSELSEYAIQKTAEAVNNFAGTGISLLCISHRSKEFVAVMDKAMALVKELLAVPEGYSVLFLQGGASLQFAMAPQNLLHTKAAYVNTGTWATKAMKEAKLFGEVVEVASSKDQNFCYIPKGWEAAVPADVDYLHYTSNNTIFGTQYRKDPVVSVPMIADMSSDIFSRPVDVSKYALIYAGAQKNVGPSGATLVIVKDELLGKFQRQVPTMMDYRTHINDGSMFNTPCTVAVYTCMEQMTYYKELGGIAGIQKINQEKADLLYNEIERNKAFRCTVPNPEDRSQMNITFILNDEFKANEAEFEALAKKAGIDGIKGHRSVGGYRASTYNSLKIESVQALVQVMKDFEASL